MTSLWLFIRYTILYYFCCQHQFFSNYKKHTTMNGVSMDGLFCLYVISYIELFTNMQHTTINEISLDIDKEAVMIKGLIKAPQVSQLIKKYNYGLNYSLNYTNWQKNCKNKIFKCNKVEKNEYSSCFKYAFISVQFKYCKNQSLLIFIIHD